MALVESLAACRAALKRLTTQVGRVATGKRAAAVTADTTLKVGGFTLSQLVTQIRAATMAHINKTGAAGHGETAASVGIHTKETWDALEPTLMPKSIVPVSRYGSLTYLPPGVLGSFEGGTTGLQIVGCAIIMEDDGTVVYLRNGTDGAKQGVYYAFYEGASQRVGNPTRTGRRYQPAWFPAGTTALGVFASSASVIFGQLQDAAGTPGDYFVALTNGTYDDSKHTGGIIPKATAEAMLLNNQSGEIFLAGDTIYLLSCTVTSASNGPTTNPAQPFDILVYTMPRATLAAANGGALTFTQVTGITTEGFGGQTYAGLDRMRFANKIVSNVASEYPIVRRVGTRFTFLIPFYYYTPTFVSAQDEVTGVIRTKIYHQSRIVTTRDAPYSPTGFSFTYNPATKVAKLDPFFVGRENTVTDDAPTPTYAGPLFEGLAMDKLVSTGPYKKVYAFDDSGNAWSFLISNLVDTLTVQAGTVTNWTSKFAALEYGVANITQKGALSVRPSFGTAIGSSLHGAVMLAVDKMYLFADGVAANGAYRRGLVYTKLEGSPTYTYESIYKGSIKGYAPSATREFLLDKGLVDSNYYAPVNEVSAAGSVKVHTQRFITLSPGVSTVSRLEGYDNIGADFSLGKPVDCLDSSLQALGNAIAAQHVANGEPKTLQFMVELIVPTNGVPPFVSMLGWNEEGNIYVCVCQVNVTINASGRVVSAGAGITGAPHYVYKTGTTSGIQMANNHLFYCGPVAMYDNGSDVLIGLSQPAYMQVPGGSPQASIAFRYNKADKLFHYRPDYAQRVYNVYSGGTGRHFVAHPTLGFGFCWNTQGTAGYSDETTKLNFQPIGKTAAELDAWTGQLAVDSSLWVCLASQKAAEGWVLYFSEETPLVLDGKYYILPVGNLDLRTVIANAANRTFYIYVRITGGQAAYVVQTGQTDESNVNMFIGTVVTNATQIVSINVEKVTRLGNARISLTAKGSAIPVSTGLPRAVDQLEWS